MKILHCSDAHADWRTSGVDRYADVADAMLQTLSAALDEKVALYLFTGDLTDPDDGPRALRALSIAIMVAHKLDEAGIASWWLAGNHDVIEDGAGRSTLSPLAELGGLVRVFDAPARAMLPGRPRVGRGAPAHAILLPYPSASKPYEPMAYVADARKALGPSSQVLVATHLQVAGATPGDETTEMARGRDVFFPFASCDPGWLLVGGHYHEGQTFERAGRKLHVPGSLVRLNHGEEKNRPRYLIWEI